MHLGCGRGFLLTVAVCLSTGCQAGQEDGSQRALPVLAAAFGRYLGAEAEGPRVGQRRSDSGAPEAGGE